MTDSALGRPLRVEKPDGGVPIKIWASELEDAALEQARNLARLPFAISHVALMPDAHPGYGMPIGGVLFADKALVPYAVGFDIGCGVALMDTSLTVDMLSDATTQSVLDEIARRVPVGNGPGAQHETAERRRAFLGLGRVSEVASQAIESAASQMGTLGGGNHFIELQADEEGSVFVMLHSGSRSVGKKICDHWHKTALELNQRWRSRLPDKELAYLPWESDEAQGYFADMTAAMSWAEQNRRHMLTEVEASLNALDAVASIVADVHHNYAAWENHLGRNGIVHRKGAVRARAGELVLVPGSMGTASYVGEGLGNRDAFETCQHGAGRARSRTATLKLETEGQFAASMAGIMLGGKAASARDESPFAYKSIEAVMADSASLVRPVSRLRPLGVVKG